MGGFTEIHLKNKSIENIAYMNEQLALEGVKKSFRFYSDLDIKLEYEAFVRGDGHFPEYQFPVEKINNFKDFKNYWSPEALGRVFCPEIGSLICDCYFGRMSQRAMEKVCRFVALFSSDIEKVSGSWSTLVERGSKNWQRKVFKEYGLV
jgi:hypothetical protein